MEDLTFVLKLGRGFFGEVWRAQEVSGLQRNFALKKVSMSLINKHKLVPQLKREIAIMSTLRHPRIVRLFFTIRSEQAMFLGMEFVVGGTLFERLRKLGHFKNQRAARNFLETCEALDYLHHLPEKIVHRDIKPENILLDETGAAKLADFGWANMMRGYARDTFCGTLEYLPPEMITGAGHTESADMWNMGVLLYELLTGRSPFGSSNKDTISKRILKSEIWFPTYIGEAAKDLISGLCKKKPGKRLQVREAMAHPFVTENSDASHGEGYSAPLPVDRPYVAERKIRREQEKMAYEMEELLKAKQQTENQLMLETAELEKMHALVREEQETRAQDEAACAELEAACRERDKELQDLIKALHPEAEKHHHRGTAWLRRHILRRSSREAQCE